MRSSSTSRAWSISRASGKSVVYTVFVDDNFHFGDESHRYRAGTFQTYEQALAAAKAVVDQSLRDHAGNGMSADEVLASWLQFGDDPFIVPSDESNRFSSRDYARERVHTVVASSAR